MLFDYSWKYFEGFEVEIVALALVLKVLAVFFLEQKNIFFEDLGRPTQGGAQCNGEGSRGPVGGEKLTSFCFEILSKILTFV